MEHFKIKYGDKTFEASEYQDIIFNDVKHGVGNMIINAAAGASKTTTIVNCMNIIEKKRVLFIAFNKEIVETIKERVRPNKKTHVSTFHSLGNSIITENLGPNFEVFDEKYSQYIRNNINDITDYKETKSLAGNKRQYINNIISLVNYSRYYLAYSLKEIEHIAKKYGIIQYRDEYAVCKRVLEWGESHLDKIDYTDMIWLPNVMNMITKKHVYDWILIDEAQDTSIAEQKLIEKCMGRGCRTIAVGDRSQQINVWCGASSEAFENFMNKPNTKEYSLPICYRCPKKIVEIAKGYSNNIIADENAIEGEIRTDVNKFYPKGGDMVLCRNTAPLIKLHLDYLQSNKSSTIKGYDQIRQQYDDLISTYDGLFTDVACNSSDGLFPTLYRRLFKEIDRVMETYHIDYEDAISQPSVFILFDSIMGLKTLSEGIVTVKELKEKLDIVFTGGDENAVQLSTVHRAKGLEADNIYILHPSLLPSKLAKLEWEKQTEKNLIYVAYTRAKKTLNFIKEDGRFDFLNNKMTIFTILKDIKSKIDYNSELGISSKDIGDEIKPTNTVKKLGETNNTGRTNTKMKGAMKLRQLLKK